MPGAADPPSLSPGNPNKPRANRGRRLSGLIALVTPRKLLRTSWHTRERQHPSHVGRPKGEHSLRNKACSLAKGK